MGDGTEQNPYTREDVRRLIEEHGGTAEGLDLSEKWFEDGIDLSEKVFEKQIDLSDLDLRGIILKNSHLLAAHLEGEFRLNSLRTSRSSFTTRAASSSCPSLLMVCFHSVSRMRTIHGP